MLLPGLAIRLFAWCFLGSGGHITWKSSIRLRDRGLYIQKDGGRSVCRESLCRDKSIRVSAEELESSGAPPSCKWCRSGWCRGKSGRGEGWLRVGRAKGDGAALAGRRRLRGDDCTHRGRASCGEGVCGVCGWSVAEAGEACGRRAWRRERGRGLGELCVRVPGTLATWPSGEGKG